MAQLILTIAASGDDITWDGLLTYSDRASATDLLIGGVGGTPGANYGHGFRFTNATIPVGATITRVRFRVMKQGTQFSSQADRWCFAAEDNCAAFSVGSPPGSRAITTNIADETNNTNETDGSVIDLPRSTTLQQTTLAAALQEVINRAGWASGNAIGLLDNSDQDASAFQNTQRKNWHSFDSAVASSEPQLVIDYTEPPPLNRWTRVGAA